jgi:acyl-CoA thioesterase-1
LLNEVRRLQKKEQQMLSLLLRFQSRAFLLSALRAFTVIAMGLPLFAHALTVMPLGDSNTYGYGDDSVASIEGYRLPVDQLMQQNGIQIQYVGGEVDSRIGWYANNRHEGHPGWIIDDLLNGRDGKSPMSWLYATQPNVVLLMIGTNDIIAGEPLWYIQWRMSYLIDVIHYYSPGSKIVVGSLLPMVQTRYYPYTMPLIPYEPSNSVVQQYNNWLASEVANRSAQGQAIALANVNGYVSFDDMSDYQNREWYGGVAVHASEHGYRMMSYAWLGPLLNFSH